MAVDLHLHSTYSDGSDTPAQLVEAAVALGLSAIAVTDHDTLEGVPAASAAAAGKPITLVPGAELSVEWPSGSLHVLAYWVEPVSGPLSERLGAIRDSRARRNLEILGALRDMGMGLTLEEVAGTDKPGVVGRPHIAAALVRRGYVPNPAAAFALYLSRGRPAYRPRERLGAGEAIALTRASGGVAVIAHPHTVADAADGFAAAFRTFADLGAAGIECHYPEYPPPMRRSLEEAAGRFGLVPTGGSDYHGTYRPEIRIGVGRGDLNVPDSLFAGLRRAAGR